VDRNTAWPGEVPVSFTLKFFAKTRRKQIHRPINSLAGIIKPADPQTAKSPGTRHAQACRVPAATPNKKRFRQMDPFTAIAIAIVVVLIITIVVMGGWLR
jgi:hypothetical protein